MAVYKIFKETALPGTLEPHAIYLVAPAAHPGYLEMYVTDAAGTAHRRTPKIADIQAMIDATVSSISSTQVVADIAARDALSPNDGSMVLVIDATADATVASGAATYVYDEDNATWVKISEAESMDITLNWEDIVGKPSSTPASIDDAVAKRHSHANKTQLDKVGEDGNGDLTYSGSLPKIAWNSTGW